MSFSLSKETLKLLIENFQEKADKDADLSDYLYRVQEEVEKVRSSLGDAEQAYRAEEERHKAAMKAIGLNLKDTRNSCKHYQATYYPDPSGNNDSETCCDICEKSLTRAERKKWMKL